MIQRYCAWFLLAAAAPVWVTARGLREPAGDTPLKVIQTTESNFPVELATQGIREGEVRAVINIDAEGKLADCLITSFTHAAFAREVMNALQSWEYEPAREQGKPVGVRTEVSFRFEARGMVLSVSAHDTMRGEVNRLFGPRPISLVCHPAELDQPLTAVEIVQPRHPGRFIKPAQPSGTATIDYYIDAEGRARMPVVLHASHDWFGAAAVQALTQWRFAPPTHQGRGVAVRVVQEFVFPESS